MNSYISPYLLLQLEDGKELLKKYIENVPIFRSITILNKEYKKLDKLDDETNEYVREYCKLYGYVDEFNLVSQLSKLSGNYNINCDDYLYNKINKWFPNISRNNSDKTIEIVKYPYISNANVIIKYEDVFNEMSLIDNILCTTLYTETNEKRMNEYLFCLQKNLDNIDIGRIIIFYELINESDILLQKVLSLLRKQDCIVYIKKRPTYEQIFNYCNENFPNKIIILTNSDIYFSKSKGLNLLQNYDYTGKCVILTRYNDLQYMQNFKSMNSLTIEHEGLKLRSENMAGYSQDTWIIKTPIKMNHLMNLEMGIVGCDNFIANSLSKNYKIINPSRTIISIHVHEGWNSGKYSSVSFNGKKMNRSEYIAIRKKEGHVIHYVGCNNL
jgi:hypothetical protein